MILICYLSCLASASAASTDWHSRKWRAAESPLREPGEEKRNIADENAGDEEYESLVQPLVRAQEPCHRSSDKDEVEGEVQGMWQFVVEDEIATDAGRRGCYGDTEKVPPLREVMSAHIDGLCRREIGIDKTRLKIKENGL